MPTAPFLKIVSNFVEDLLNKKAVEVSVVKSELSFSLTLNCISQLEFVSLVADMRFNPAPSLLLPTIVGNPLLVALLCKEIVPFSLFDIFKLAVEVPVFTVNFPTGVAVPMPTLPPFKNESPSVAIVTVLVPLLFFKN